MHCPEGVSTLLAVLFIFFLTSIAWVFFRAQSIAQALYILKAIFSWDATAHLSFGGMKYQLLRVALVVAIVLAVDFLSTVERARSLYLRSPYTRAIFTGLVVLMVLFTGRFAATSFIYFQF